MVAANGTLEEAVALTAAANTIIQDADVVGTALKTVAMRLRGTDTKTMEEEGLDTEGAVTSKSKLRSKVKALSGVDILTDTGAYKSTYQILSEIAKVWEDIGDQDQAALLELLAGKRAGSVMSAILNNPDILKNAFEDANNAAGSALRENEKYLDSIQGRIDLFTNAVQTMWSNALDSDVVKGFINFGTQLVKIIDKVGLLNSILISLATISMFKNKVGPITFFKDLIGLIPKGVKSLQTWIQGMQTSDAQTIKSIATKNADTASTTANTEANIANAASSTVAGAAEDKDTADTIENTAATVVDTTTTNANTEANIANAASNAANGASAAGAVTSVGGAAAGATTAFTGLAAAVPYILGAIVAIGVGVAIFKAVTKSTEELKEELDDLNSEISSIESEIDSLNSELETTQDRMAELLAMDSLSFTDAEELENLKAQNAELERQIELNKILLKNKEQERISKTKEVLDKTFYNKSSGKDDYAIDADGAIIHDDFWHVGMGGKKALDKGIAKYIQSKKSSEQYNEAYKAVLKSYNNGTLSEDDKNLKYLRTNTITTTFDDNSIDTLLKRAEEQSQAKKDIVQKQESGISMVLGEMSDIIKENELSYALDDEEINKFLDEYYAYSIKFQNAQGAASKSSVISAIFDQTANESIKNLKNELDGIADSGDDTATKIANAQSKIDTALADTTGQYQRLKTFMDTVGVSAQELAEYFVAASEAPDISTQEGVIQVYQDAIDIIGKYKKAEDEVLGKDEGGNDITWSNLFTQDDSGKWVADKLKVASILEGSDEDIRKEFTKIAEAVQNGEMTVEDATKKLDLSGARRVLDIEIKSLSEANLDIFPDLKEDINGIIDKFEELSKAVGGTVDALDTLKQARAEEAYSGSVSIETLENLMKYTDDYSKIVSVDETGAIRLATDAEDILIESRLEKIKQDANATLSEAELAYQEALNTQQTVTKTGPAQEVLKGVMNQVGGAIAFVTSMWSDLTSGNWAGSWERAQQARASAIAKNEPAYANKEAEANTSLAEAEANLKKAQDNAKIANSLTKDNVKTKYSSDAASGGASTPEEVAKNAFQEEMDYWENRISANRAKYEQIQNEIDLLEKQGKKAGKEYYEEQIDLENGRLSLLAQQKQAAQTYLDTLQEGSDEWWDAANTLNDIEGEIDDVTASLQDLSDAIAEIDLYVFEETHNRFKNLIDDLETIRNLIAQNGEEDWFDDEGMWTEKGVAVLGTYIQQYEMYKNALESVNEELKKYQKEYAGNEEYYKDLGIDSEQELYNKQRELIDQQYEYAQAVNDTENSVKDAYEAQIDAIEEYCDELVDAYNDYIDVVKEALDAERD